MSAPELQNTPTIRPQHPEDQRKLLSHTANLAGLLADNQLGLWCWPLQQAHLLLSDTARTLLGLSPDQPEQNYLQRVHPDDQVRVQAFFAQLAQGHPLTTPLNHRIRGADGQIRWLQLSGQLQTPEHGTPQLLGLLRESRTVQTYEIPHKAKDQGFQHLFQAIPQALLLQDLHTGGILDISPSFEQLLGWTAEQIIGRTPWEIGIWSDPQQLETLRATMLKQPLVLNQPVRVRNRYGQELQGLLSWQQLRLDDTDCLLASFTDTSYQIATETALRNSEERFAKAFHSAPDSMSITDLESTCFLEVNPSFERQFGYSASEVLGRSSLDIGIWIDPEQRHTLLHKVTLDGHVEAFEANLRRRNGEISHNLIYGDLVTLNGRGCLVLSVRDITLRRQQDGALKDSQERLNLALESAELGLWDWDLRSGRLFASARTTELHGLGAQIYDGPMGGFFTYVPQADQQAGLKTFQRLRDGQQSDFRVTYRVINNHSATRYLESTAKLYADAQGRPERMIGVVHDITSRTLREQALSASEEKFTTLFQASPEAICVTDLSDGRFIEINPSFTQSFGWSPREIVGKTAIEMNFWVDFELRKRLGEQLLDEQQLNDVTAQFHTRDGRTLSCIIAARLIRIDRRRCLITNFRDITARESANLALKLSEEKFAKAFHASPDSISITELSSGRFIEVNEGFCRLTGYRPEEVVGRTSLELNTWTSTEERNRMLAILDRDGQVHHLEMQALRRDGLSITVEVSVTSITIDGKSCLLLIARDISDLKQAQAQIQHLAYHDPLTNLPNRALLMDRLSQQIALLKRHGLRGALLFLDLDHFKHINDSLGHPLGDAVLKMIAARLESSIRQEDTVARLGGDEFVVLISGLEGKRSEVTRQVRLLANKLRQLLAEPMTLEGHRLQVTPSIGMVLIPDHGDSPADLLKRADIALYRAKDSGRNTLQMFRKNMQEAASQRLRLENDLRLAISNGEFELYFQPQVDARSGQIVGAEALLRWNQADHLAQSPGTFIQVLEESGLIVEVGSWVLNEASRVCAQWVREQLIKTKEFSLCINISPRQFRQPGFVEQVEHCLRSNHLAKSLLTLEITEGIVIQNIDDTISKMLQLKKLGVSFAMDDFGTGYSSLTYLKRLPVDILKIDQSFVRDATVDPSDAEIIRAIVGMAQSLGLEMIAEGVEQQEQLQFLQQQGCHCYQGYLFSKPLPLAQFSALLAQARANPAQP